MEGIIEGPHVKAAKFLRELIAEWEAGEPDCLGLAHKLVSVIELEYGGPTSWIEYDHATGNAAFYSTRWNEEAGTYEPVSVPLLREDADRVAEWFALEDAGIAALDNTENLIG